MPSLTGANVTRFFATLFGFAARDAFRSLRWGSLFMSIFILSGLFQLKENEWRYLPSGQVLLEAAFYAVLLKWLSIVTAIVFAMRFASFLKHTKGRIRSRALSNVSWDIQGQLAR